jgi:predicted ATPase/DNA-binding winged helix-turn-helix (wHTH) protein
MRLPMDDASRPVAPAAALRFGRHELRPAERAVLLDGQPLPVGARAFDVLLALVERRERVVGKHELLEAAWPGLVVEENNIAVQVSSLRRLLGDGVIATIPGRGYRFTAVADAPPAAVRPAAPAAGNLPPPITLYGRDDDLRTLGALLTRHPVVTVVGAGGIGKTQLALAAAAEADAAAWPDGRWWVELATVNDGAQVAATAAARLGLGLPPDRPPGAALAAALARRRLLLVLDNAEHVADDTAALVDALREHAPQVGVLITSQELLKCRDEQLLRLGSLATPAPGTPGSGEPAGAAALFVARVQALQPRFVPGPDNAGAVAEICRRLDGIPLAIELAAARVPLLGIEGLRSRLDRMFQVLTGASRVTLRRHQTLRAAMQWSHGLLDADERALFRRLGVFVGGFTLPLAQRVAGDERIDDWALLDLLGHLVDKSLVVVEGSDDAPRYRLLEPTRAFAMEQLTDAGEAPEMLRRHAVALLDLLTPAEAARWSLAPADRDALPRELGNLRAALDWAALHERKLAYRLHAKGWLLFWLAGAMAEGQQRMLALWPPPADLAPEVEAGFCLALYRCHGENALDEIVEATRRAIGGFRRLGDRGRLTDALLGAAMMGVLRNDQPDTQALLDEAALAVGPDAPPRLRASLALVEGSWAWRRGDYDAAEAALTRQRDCYLETGLELGVLMATNNRCGVLLDRGDYALAAALAASTLEPLRSASAPALAWGLIYSLLGRVMLGDDDHAALLALAREAYERGLGICTTYQQVLAAAIVHARCGELRRAALVAGFAERLRQGQKFHPVAVDRRMDEQLRELVLARHAPRELDGWLAEGARLDEPRALALAFGDAETA